MKLNSFGQLAEDLWKQLPEFFPYINLYDFVIMPNHIHGIIQIKDTGNILNNLSYNPSNYRTDKRVQKIPVIISSYKSGVTREINKISGQKHYGWQSSFYDRVIRNEEEFEAISLYIIKNPLNWKFDIEYEDYMMKSEEKIKASEIFKYYNEIVNGK
ncbi:MAG: hypothetical protein L0Y76_08615, partial [Ignavibacteria bacterium]|nr:hypothetical protein [Ignavibacteria bacterium]